MANLLCVAMLNQRLPPLASAFESPSSNSGITLHSYRARWGEAEPDPRSRWLEDKIKTTRTLSLPTLYFQGAADGVNPPSASKETPGKFTGHFAQRENPDAVAQHLLRLFTGDPVAL